MNPRRAAQIVLGLVVLVMAVLSIAASAIAVPEAGVTSDIVGGTVADVVPGSPAWRAGIRPGEQIVELRGSETDEGWELWTTDGTLPQGTSTADHVAIMRSFIPWSLIALIVAGLAAFLSYRRQAAAAGLLPIALFLAAQPLFLAGSLVAELVAGVVLFAAAAIAVIAFSHWQPSFSVALAVGLACAGMWVVSILAFPTAFDVVDSTRAPVAAGFSVMGFAIIADRRRILEFMTGRSGPAFVDLLYLGLAVAILIAGVLAGFFVMALVVTVLALFAYPFWRRATVSSFERLVTSQARRDASIRAIEEERGRLAREIHDSPLQELSGVIRRLETVPGAEREADALRAVAGQLRDVATSLHPPVLHDLGLAAAIEDLGDQLRGIEPEWRISVEVDDLTSAGRPPADVELAAFRVTQEATTNAIAHSGGRCLDIRGSVAPEVIDLAVTDDGHGLLEDEARKARRAGHFGLDSIRERAEAAGGTTDLATTPAGVCIRFRWESPA